MTAVAQLTFQCEQWRILLKAKNEKYAEIKEPLDRIEPAFHIIHIRMEKAMMEDELCTHLLVPPHLYQPKPMNTFLRKHLQHEGFLTLLACAMAAYFLMLTIPQNYFRLNREQQREQIQSLKKRMRRKANLLLDLEEYDCY